MLKSVTKSVDEVSGSTGMYVQKAHWLQHQFANFYGWLQTIALAHFHSALLHLWLTTTTVLPLTKVRDTLNKNVKAAKKV